MLLIEITQPQHSDLDIVLGHIFDNTGIEPHVAGLISRHPDCVYRGPMYRWLYGGYTKPTNEAQFACWSKSMEGVQIAMDSLAHGQGYTGVIISQTGTGFDINQFIHHNEEELYSVLEEDDMHQLEEYLMADEVVSPYNNPQTIATVDERGNIKDIS
jgi:hypothetical protein